MSIARSIRLSGHGSPNRAPDPRGSIPPECRNDSAFAGQHARGDRVVGAYREQPAPVLYFIATRHIGLPRIIRGKHAVRWMHRTVGNPLPCTPADVDQQGRLAGNGCFSWRRASAPRPCTSSRRVRSCLRRNCSRRWHRRLFPLEIARRCRTSAWTCKSGWRRNPLCRRRTQKPRACAVGSFGSSGGRPAADAVRAIRPMAGMTAPAISPPLTRARREILFCIGLILCVNDCGYFPAFPRPIVTKK